MVPVCENEILIFYGEGQNGFRPYILAFNPAKLELKALNEQQNYQYSSD